MTIKNKALIAVVIFVVLLGVVFLLHENPYKANDDVKLPVIPEVDVKTIDKVELVNKSDSLIFEKRGEDWWITGSKEYQADKSFFSLVVEKLGKIELERLVSENKEKHAQFEVDQEGTRLKAFSKGQEVRSLIVGKNTPDYRGTFLRLKEDDKVYASKQIVSGALKRKLSDWRDKALWETVPTEQFASVSVTLGTSEFTLTHTPSTPAEGDKPAVAEKWSVKGDDKFSVDKARANGLTQTLSGMRWSDVVDEPASLAEYGLDKPSAVVSFSKTDGSGHKVLIGNVDEEKKIAWIAVDNDPKVYQIKKYQHEKLVNNKDFYKGNSEEAK